VLTIGLTGGIGCGKTTVSQLFENKDIPVIDADEIAHAIVQKGAPALALLSNSFGENILNTDGSLNRNHLRELVFNHPDEKEKLEGILHPLIYKEMFQQLKHHDSPYGILSIPLLFETRQQSKVDRIVVIDCPEETQKQRVRARDQLSDTMIDSIMNSQCSRSFRRKHADDILNNDSTLANLEDATHHLHKLYLKISTGKNCSHPAK